MVGIKDEDLLFFSLRTLSNDNSQFMGSTTLIITIYTVNNAEREPLMIPHQHLKRYRPLRVESIFGNINSVSKNKMIF